VYTVKTVGHLQLQSLVQWGCFAEHVWTCLPSLAWPTACHHSPCRSSQLPAGFIANTWSIHLCPCVYVKNKKL
jgi:hypothetical protein